MAILLLFYNLYLALAAYVGLCVYIKYPFTHTHSTVMEEQFHSPFIKQHPSHIVFTQGYQLTGSQSREAPHVGFALANRDLMTEKCLGYCSALHRQNKVDFSEML